MTLKEYIEIAMWAAIVQAIKMCITNAYTIRLHAINEYGPIIHEFDPYFNYRATEYLYYNGWQKFATWFDYRSWYPLGRPVGTTIYPGMQVSAVFIKNWIVGDKMSLNDVCCYMPAWFGVSASFFTGLLAYECTLPQNSSGSIFTFLIDIYRGKIRDPEKNSSSFIPAAIAGVFAMAIMSMIPAHLMRSVGGGFDNESVAITAMTLTFWLWCRSLRANAKYSYLFGIATGIAYFYMVAAWGGYIFVLNLIGLHAAFLVLVGRFSTKVYLAYSLFYVVGTALAIQVPVVGLTPLKSLEQLGPAAVFLGYQLLQYCEIKRRREKLSRTQALLLRFKIALIALCVGGLIIYALAPQGYFGPLSSRVRGLFVKHTKTGNPLVDSVAEHQPASADAYKRYVHNMVYVAPAGLAMISMSLGDAPSFLVIYACAAYFFSSKMVRLILLLGPIASILGGIASGKIFAWCIGQFIAWDYDNKPVEPVVVEIEQVTNRNNKKTKKDELKVHVTPASDARIYSQMEKTYARMSSSIVVKLAKMVISGFVAWKIFNFGTDFTEYCWETSKGLSHPSITMKGTTNSGIDVVVDDYREAYTWLKENTPEDARVLAWWDYGYQISAIANRTTIADGNTWNHEHIALLGRILTSPEKDGHRIARHLADYVLIWAGGGGDDLAKSPHLARIATSVYRDMCPGDPTCRRFHAQDQNGNPSKMMQESLLFKLHGHNNAGIKADPNRFKEVYKSKYGKVRIFKIMAVSKESKAWVADPANRICDSPGSWFCRGQYPPALNKVLVQKKDFAQLEDFNTDKKDEDYQRKYFEHLNNPSKAQKAPKGAPSVKPLRSSEETSDPSQWEDTAETTRMWELIERNDLDEFKKLLKANPALAFLRSGDGRGPMWWAFERRRDKFIKYLMKIGVSYAEKDKSGRTPLDLQ